MEYIDHKIILDVHEMVSPVTVSMKRRETGRRLMIHLADRGYPYHIDDECYAVFTATKPDGKVIYNECTIDACVIIYNVTEQTSCVAGLVSCEIQIYNADGLLLTSPVFDIVVEDTIYDEETEVESTSEFSALTRLIAEVQELKKEIGSGTSSGSSSVTSVTISEVTLLAAKWVGADSPYSQVVSINGITERSLVTLQPSVEQLNIFHDKDLAFVTENDDGVVTVYAIGDKPQNDYTIQVSITEVNV